MATYYGGWKKESSTGVQARLYLVTSYTQNQSGNYTDITVKTYVQVSNNRTILEGVVSAAYADTNINSVHAYGSTSSTFGVNATKLLSTKTVNVPHNADGTAGCWLSATGNVSVSDDNGYITKLSLSVAGQVETFPTIIRSSSISNDTSSSNYKDFGSAVTFSISRPSTETHTLKYWAGGTEYTIGSGIETSVSYTFPTSLINSYPNNAYTSIVVTCYSSNGTTSSTTVYLKVPDNYVPNCSLAISDVGDVPSSWGIWLKSKSKISASITASGSAGSTISSYNTSANGATYTSSSFTTDYLKNSGSQTITSTVADSRGRQKSDSKTISVVDYWTPTLSSFSVVRCNAEGVEENEGTYGKVKCNYSIAPCSNKNTKSLIVKYGDVSKTFTLNSYSGTVEANSSELFSDLSTASNHAFEFYIIDYFNSNGIKYGFTMTPAFTTISYLNGGKGVSIGQVASEEGFHVHMESDFHNGLKKNGNEVPSALNSKSTSTTDTYSCNYVNNKTTTKYLLASVDYAQEVSSNFLVGLNRIVSKNGDFDLVSNAIWIPNGVSKVEVSGAIFLDAWPAGTYYLWAQIRVNNVFARGAINTGPGSFLSAVIPPVELDVSVNDKITLICDSPGGGITRAGDPNIWLYVKAIG